MAIYVVMEPGGRADAAAGDAAFVRDGWHFFAFLVPFAWFLWHRMWIEAALAIGAALLLAALDAQGGFTLVATGLSLLIAIYAGLEAPALRIAALRRRGWREAAVVEAGSSAEAEIRYFSGEEPGPAAQPPLPAPTPGPAGPRPGGPALGLFAYPGGR